MCAVGAANFLDVHPILSELFRIIMQSSLDRQVVSSHPHRMLGNPRSCDQHMLVPNGNAAC